jgi:phage terminase small subunit
MQALTPLQRAFVKALLEQTGKLNATKAAVAAGYMPNSRGGAAVVAHHLMKNQRVISALHEVSKQSFKILGWRAVLGIARIAEDQKHPDHFRALKELKDSFGFAQVHEQSIKVEHTDRSGAEMMRRIRLLAEKHGMNPDSLLGGNNPTKVIEHEPQRPIDVPQGGPGSADPQPSDGGQGG